MRVRLLVFEGSHHALVLEQRDRTTSTRTFDPENAHGPRLARNPRVYALLPCRGRADGRLSGVSEVGDRPYATPACPRSCPGSTSGPNMRWRVTPERRAT